MFDDSLDRDFSLMMDETVKAVANARKKEAIMLTNQRIRRCEELLVYVIAMCQIGTTSEVVSDAMATDIKFIYSELHSWKFTGQGIESYSELMSVIIQIKAALIKTLEEQSKEVQA